MHTEHRIRIAVLLGVMVWAANAAAQNGVIQGRVSDADGRAIKGATIRASNPNGKPPRITATTDDKGRFAMVGMTGGAWTFVAEAPGFSRREAQANVRSTSTGNPLVVFALVRTIEPLPNALSKQILADIAAADQMRDSGRLDQAIDAYEDLRTKHPTLTMLNLVIGDAYRQKAAREQNPSARQPLYERALASYQAILKIDPDNGRAKAEIARTQQQRSSNN